MGEEESLSQEEWAALFGAAIAFKALKCCQWMYDRHVFGVQNPETGGIGYWCVIGQLGEVLALNVYPGPKGLASFCLLQGLEQPGASGGTLGSYALLSTQYCLMAPLKIVHNYMNKIYVSSKV